MFSGSISRSIACACLLTGLCVLSSGCLLIDASSEKKAAHPTVGQQLVDLKTAREKGVINDEEYEKSRQRILADCHN